MNQPLNIMSPTANARILALECFAAKLFVLSNPKRNPKDVRRTGGCDIVRKTLESLAYSNRLLVTAFFSSRQLYQDF